MMRQNSGELMQVTDFDQIVQEFKSSALTLEEKIDQIQTIEELYENQPQTSTMRQLMPHVLKSAVVAMILIDTLCEDLIATLTNSPAGAKQTAAPAVISTLSDFCLNIEGIFGNINKHTKLDESPAPTMATWKKVTINGTGLILGANAMLVVSAKTYGFVQSANLIKNPSWLKTSLSVTGGVAAAGTTLLTDIWCLSDLLNKATTGSLTPYKYKATYALGVPLLISAGAFYYSPLGLGVMRNLTETNSLAATVPSAAMFGATSLAFMGNVVLETIDDVIDAMMKLVTEGKADFKQYTSATLALAISGYLNYYYSSIGENFDKKTFDNDTLLQVTNGFLITYLTILSAKSFYVPIKLGMDNVTSYVGSFFSKPVVDLPQNPDRQPLLQDTDVLPTTSQSGNKILPITVETFDEAHQNFLNSSQSSNQSDEPDTAEQNKHTCYIV